MRLSPQQTFQTGHDLAYCSTYFDQVLFASRLANQKEDLPKLHAQNMIEMLQKIGPNFARRLQLIDSTCQTLNMPKLPIPALPPEFYPWVNIRHNQFLENWQATDPVGIVFVLGHCLGELRNGFIIANIAIDFERNIGLDCQKEMKGIPSRLREILIRWHQAETLIQDSKLKDRFGPTASLLKTKLPTIINLLDLPTIDEQSIAQPIIQKVLEILSHSEREISTGLSTGII